MKIIEHTFGLGHTVEGAIKLHNRHGMISKQLNKCLEQFYVINGEQRVFHPGEIAKIPILYPAGK